MLLLSNNKPIKVIGKAHVAIDIVNWVNHENLIPITNVTFEDATSAADFDQYQYIVGIAGDINLRVAAINWIKDNNLHSPAYIHPMAHVEQPEMISTGTVISPGSVIFGRATIDNYCYVSPMCLISHGDTIGESVILRPYSSVLGGSHVSKYTVIETAAIISDGVAISAPCVRILPKAFVSKDITITGTYGGTPARRISQDPSCTL